MRDRAAGCIVGAFIGDALGLGPHWYYDVAELRREFGPWITDYTEPKADGYHAGLKAGELSQSGLIMQMLLESLAERGGYDEVDFCGRLDAGMLPKIEGTDGPGGYTNHSMRQVAEARKAGKSWAEAGGHADTSEGAERAALIAARYAGDRLELAKMAASNVRVSQSDSLVVQQSVAFALVLGALIRGEAFDERLSGKLMQGVGDGSFPFVEEYALKAGTNDERLAFASPDALLLPSWIARAARDPEVRIEPAWKVSQVYGMSCAINFVLPAAYYLAARFSDDFEGAVLNALNGGGQNMSRACLTGALVGAQVGLSGIPERFVTGLRDGEGIVELARRVAREVS